MKKYLMLSVSLVLFCALSSCKKDTVSSATTLNGSWELRYVVGIQVANADPNFKPGNGNIYTFDNGKYQIYQQSKVVDSGTYVIQKDERQINNNTSTHSVQITSKVYSSRNLYIKLSASTLIVFDGVIAADGIEATYEKIDNK
jgi:hypothetical protein